MRSAPRRTGSDSVEGRRRGPIEIESRSGISCPTGAPVPSSSAAKPGMMRRPWTRSQESQRTDMRLPSGRTGRHTNSPELPHGQAVVEFALIVPVLLLLLVGISDWARLYTTGINVEAAAREA